MESYKDIPSLRTRMEKLLEYDYNFENLAFSGGGAKLMAFTGCGKVLEVLGILKKCRRFAGTSGGAIAAALGATGHSMQELRELMNLNVPELIEGDSLCTQFLNYLTFLPNMWRKFGWHKADGLYEAIREMMRSKTGNADITFAEVYVRYGKELCIVATNVSTSSPEYFHPKTTPDVSVAKAVRCSCSIPGVMQPFEVEFENGMRQLYVDGGMMANYPLHVYDGWYLSMKPEDSFFNKLGSTEAPFGDDENYNKKTLGTILVTLKDKFNGRKPWEELNRPNTQLARSRQEEATHLIQQYKERDAALDLGKHFLEELEQQCDGDDSFTATDLEEVYQQMQLRYTDQMQGLFQGQVDLEMLKGLFAAKNGKMTLHQLILFLQRQGISWLQVLDGRSPRQPKSVLKFYSTLTCANMALSRKVHQKPVDIQRTVGLFTDYIQTTDFALEQEDLDFLVKQGEIGAIQYFEELVKSQTDAMKGIAIPKNNNSHNSRNAEG